MRKILFLIYILALSYATIGCSSTEEPLSTIENIEKLEESPLDYKIENIVLSKSFQFLDSNVEILEKNKSLKLLASVGLIESSGIEIKKITQIGNTINIYINRLLNGDQIQLAVPQIKFEISSPISQNPKDLNFNIIHENYKPISIKFNKNQILDKIYKQFKIEPNTVPQVTLNKYRGDIFWNISFSNIFDKENQKSPLINLNVEVDALTGEILDSNKENISSYIDEGYLLDYIPNSFLLYKTEQIKNGTLYESLWTYNMETGTRNNLFTTRHKIHSALFSQNSEYISLIEIDESKTQTYLYLIERPNKLSYKITPIHHLQPKLIRWKDNVLYFVDIKDKTSTLLTYNVEDKECKTLFKIDKVIDSFDILGDRFLLTEPTDYSLKKNIFITHDGDYLKEIGTGFKASFLDENNIMFLENIEKKDKNILNIYDLEEDRQIQSLNYDIANYYKLNNEEILFIEKASCNNNYILTEYNLNEKTPIFTATITSDRIFFDSNKKKDMFPYPCPMKKIKEM